MLKGNKVRLRAVEPEDLDLMYLIENDTELWSCGHNTVPFSYYALKQYLSENTNDLFRDRQLRFVIETTEGIGVGFLDLMHFEPLHLRAEVGIVVLAEQQHCGIATEALQLLKEYAFSFLGLKQLYAYIPDDNIASQALFSRCGYKKTATLQDWLKTPAGWQSVYVFQLLA